MEVRVRLAECTGQHQSSATPSKKCTEYTFCYEIPHVMCWGKTQLKPKFCQSQKGKYLYLQQLLALSALSCMFDLIVRHD